MLRNGLFFLRGTCVGASIAAGLVVWSRGVVRLLAAGCLSAALSFGQIGSSADGIQFVAVEDVPEFPGATEDGAIRFACAADREELEAFFVSREAEFNPSLVRKPRGQGFCHVFYEPTIRGFRASPDDAEVQHLYASVDPVGLVVQRKSIGDSLGILKDVLAHTTRQLNVTVITHDGFKPEFWPDAKRHHFPATPHHILLDRHPGRMEHLWAQDFMKPGEAGGRLTILVTRRLFEGRGEVGVENQPFLDAMNGHPFVRSKLSWEGGDLQFVADPRNPRRRILFYGGSANDYWGAGRLTSAESQYVLRTEFGADLAVDLSAIGPHADFLVSFLPADRIALVATPERQNYALAKAAARALVDLYGPQSPKELHQLERLVDDPNEQPAADPDAAVRLIRGLFERLPQIPPPVSQRLETELTEFLDLRCPDRAESCFDLQGTRALFQANPDLMRRTTNVAADHASRSLLAPRLLALIESQLPNAPRWKEDLLDRKANEIHRLGFRVIRVPYLIAPKKLDVWAGISYVNLVMLDRMLLVPTFGLGEAEGAILANLAKNVGRSYRVIPIDARFSLVFNGGVHCAFAVVREVGPKGLIKPSDDGL